jgi:hypothetical protein
MVKMQFQTLHIEKNNKCIVSKILTFGFLFIFIVFIDSSNVQARGATSKASVNKSYAVFTLTPGLNKLSKGKVRMLFRGKLKYLQGSKVELSDWPQSNNIRRTFYKELLGKDTAQMNAYWASLSFSGKARPPKEINNDSMEALVTWLSAKRFRIGYAPIGSLPKDAHVLYIVNMEKQ